MPKAELSAPGRIMNFFNTAPLETADLVLQLARDAVLARKRATAAAAAQSTATVVAKPAAAPKKKRSHHKKKATPAPTPTLAGPEAYEAPAEAGDAPPAPPA